MATVKAGNQRRTGEVTIRACATTEEFQECIQLQKAIWDFADADVLPVRLFVVGTKIGGQVFGAFDSSGRMVGFCIAIPGIRNGKAYLHSHMLGVLPEYQNRRLGRSLKLMQREDALARDIPLIEWTFDPLEVKNGFFNIERLGVIVRRYVPNQYGVTSSALHGGLPTDRLVAEWWVGSDRVAAVVGGQAQKPVILRRIAVAANIGEIKKRDRNAALKIQDRLREEFLDAFENGLTVTGFERGDPEDAYLLEKIEGPTL